MAQWFRIYHEILDDPKVQRLPSETFKAWVNLLCVAARYDGLLPSVEVISFALRAPEGKVKKLLTSLQNAGLLEETEQGITPHNWEKRQWKSDDSNERVKRHRERKRNDDVTVTVTPPETETETDTDKPPLNPPQGGEREEETEEGEPDPQDRENWKALFAFWQQLYQHPNAKFTRQREAKLRARLKDGYTLEDCASAIRGLQKSRWHMGENPEGRVWDEWSLIFQSGEKLERFKALDPKLQVVK